MSTSKAATFGTSNAFSTAASARRSARAQMYDAATGKVHPDADNRLPVTVISSNPDNPRDHLRNLNDLIQSVVEVDVVNAIAVSTVEAYLAERPDRAGELQPDAQYVVVDGHRRLEAARRAGRDTIKVIVDDHYVATDERLLEAAFVANYHRENMNELEEANALATLVQYYGSQTKAAQRLGIAQSTIASKLSFLKLTPVLQADLSEGRRTAEQVRNLGRKSPEEQIAEADARAQAAKEQRERRATTRREPPARREVSTPDAVSGPAEPLQEQLSRRDNPAPSVVVDPEAAVSRPLTAVPDPRPQPEQSKGPTRMPWADGPAAMDLIVKHMIIGERPRALGRYIELVGGPDVLAAELAEAVAPEERRRLAEALLKQLSQ